MSKELAPGTGKSILRQAGLEKGRDFMTYAIVIEQTLAGYSAYVPYLPGCVAATDSYEDTKKLIREAVVFHWESLREHGDPNSRTEDFGRVGGGARRGINGGHHDAAHKAG